jgi:uncharacterized protein (DUF2267 family)
MPTTHLSILDNSHEETLDWLDRVLLELDDDDRHLALAALRGVLHALRDQLTIEQSAHLSAQLPTFIRGLYFEQWKPDAPKPGRDLESFLLRVDESMGGYAERCSAEEATRAVFAAIAESVTGAGEKIANTLPMPIRNLWY